MTCHCGHHPPPTPPDWWPATHGDIRQHHINELAAIRSGLERIEGKLTIMSEREDAADARQAELIQLVRDGIAAKDAQIAALQEALANAGVVQAAALEAASQDDAGRQEAVNSALEELAGVPAPPVEPPVDPNA